MTIGKPDDIVRTAVVIETDYQRLIAQYDALLEFARAYDALTDILADAHYNPNVAPDYVDKARARLSIARSQLRNLGVTL